MPTNRSDEIELSIDELREIAGFAVECALRALPIFERYVPDDSRPREAIEAAFAFSKDGKRSNTLRASGLAAFKAGRAVKVNAPAAAEAAQAATQAVGAAFLHPLAKAHQVGHILGSAAYAARAAELEAGDNRSVGAECRDWAIEHAHTTVALVLTRYPAAPAGGGRVGELLRELDAALRP
ncbi:MAG: putative immunity protein [Capsulimonas sp.]|uniref:putative immunity protein n=1 Tax=Capsulimonas sp. TaxID=2494211 RepID=UPI00326730B5